MRLFDVVAPCSANEVWLGALNVLQVVLLAFIVDRGRQRRREDRRDRG